MKLRDLTFALAILICAGLNANVFSGETTTNRIRAVAAIFADEHVAQEALQVHHRALKLDEAARFELLSAWVLPSDDHQTLRMQCEFTQTCPAPMFDRSGAAQAEKSDLKRGQSTGGDLVSPVMDLVEVAARLNRLDEIQSVVDQWKPTSPEDEKSRTVFRLLIAIAKKDEGIAELQMREILTLAVSSPGSAREPHSEAVALWAGSDFDATREVARELALQLHQSAWDGAPPCNERWIRQIIGRHFRLDESLASAKSISDVQSQQPTLKSWVAVSRMNAETRGAGYPITIWRVGNGEANHLAGHHDDYLYFASPLTGHFSVEADLTTFDFRDIHLGFGGHWAGPRYDLKSCATGMFRREGEAVPVNPPLTRMLDSMRIRMVVGDGTQTTFANGRKIHEQPHGRNDDPWLSIHSSWHTHGSVRNLRVLGDPVIPASVPLITPDLAGWVGYFDESVVGQDADWLATPSRGTEGKPDEGSMELISHRRPDRDGTLSESLLRYHRPMMEDGRIEYEFFYQPGESLVHPCLDRLTLMLNPTSVDVHWITDGRHEPDFAGA